MDGSFFAKAYGSAVIAMTMVGQRRIPYLPEEQLREMRDKRVRWMVRYAAETVPFYRDFFRSERIDPGEIQCAEDLDRFPLIDKQVVREQPERFVSTSRWGRTALPFPTTGSTGAPLTVFHDRYSLLANAAYSEREREAVRRVVGRGLNHRAISIDYSTSTGHLSRGFLRENTFLPIGAKRTSLSLLEPMERIVAAINECRPVVISSYGSYLELLFKTIATQGIPMHLPKVLVYASDVMTDGGKHLIEEDLGVTVLSKYNAVEAFKIGFSCEERTGFHLHDGLTHVKIVDADGQRVAKGEKGEVVISNLINRGTVLLNYRLGDVASATDERCPCGRTLPLLASLEGRIEDIIHLPDGRFVHPRLVCGVLENRAEVVQYQLIQHEPDVFEFRLATVDRAAFERIIGDILIDLRGLLGQSVTIEAMHYEKLKPHGAGRKFRPVLSLITRNL